MTSPRHKSNLSTRSQCRAFGHHWRWTRSANGVLIYTAEMWNGDARSRRRQKAALDAQRVQSLAEGEQVTQVCERCGATAIPRDYD